MQDAFFEALAVIASERFGATVTVKSVKKVEEKTKETEKTA